MESTGDHSEERALNIQVDAVVDVDLDQAAGMLVYWYGEDAPRVLANRSVEDLREDLGKALLGAGLWGVSIAEGYSDAAWQAAYDAILKMLST